MLDILDRITWGLIELDFELLTIGECDIITQTFELETPYQILLLDKEPQLDKTIRAKIKKLKEHIKTLNPLTTTFYLFGNRELNAIVDICFDEDMTMAQLFEELNKQQVKYLNDKLNIVDIEDCYTTVHLYNIIKEYQQELLYGYGIVCNVL